VCVRVCVLQNGEKSQSPGEFACPEGWSWEDQWVADENRAVDEQGGHDQGSPPAPWEPGTTGAGGAHGLLQPLHRHRLFSGAPPWTLAAVQLAALIRLSN